MANAIRANQIKLEEVHAAWKQDYKKLRNPAFKNNVAVGDYLDVATSESASKLNPSGTALKEIMKGEGLRFVSEGRRPASKLKDFLATEQTRALLLDCIDLFARERFGRAETAPTTKVEVKMEGGERATGTILDHSAGSIARPYTDAAFGIKDEIVPDITLADVIGPTPEGSGKDYRQPYVTFTKADLEEEEVSPTTGPLVANVNLAEESVVAKRRAFAISIDDSLLDSDIGTDAFMLTMSQVFAQREVNYVNRALVEATTNIPAAQTREYTGNSTGVTSANFIAALRFLKSPYAPNLIIGHEASVIRFLHAVNAANIRETLALTQRVPEVPNQLTLVNRLPQDLRVIMLDDNVPALTDATNRTKLLFMNRMLGVGLYTQSTSVKDKQDEDIMQGIMRRVLSRTDAMFTVGAGEGRALLTFSS